MDLKLKGKNAIATGVSKGLGEVAAFLVSTCASWVVGTCLVVDGRQHKENS